MPMGMAAPRARVRAPTGLYSEYQDLIHFLADVRTPLPNSEALVRAALRRVQQPAHACGVPCPERKPKGPKDRTNNMELTPHHARANVQYSAGFLQLNAPTLSARRAFLSSFVASSHARRFSREREI